ncbi:PIR Superfamily Protein [Plasmodium ovale curtisi]|uniref:PIR Superfamily Protein n=1 Tax=Plasmodium ovale curtisi TaxID=864141 RepID=A0A1A8WM33_PLAOA|nr:PIR Superfamily Protein [Plasmodium ovale curtisi]
MSVEVSFLKSERRRSRTEDCNKEYGDIEEEVKNEVDIFKKKKEDDVDFNEKCQTLRDYLNDYNKNNEKCFVSALSPFYEELKNYIEEALDICPNPPKKQVELDPEEIKRMSQDQLGQQGSELENPEQKALGLGKKIEAAAHCKDKPCDTENLVREGLPDTRETREDGITPRNEETATENSQDVGSLNQILQPGHAQPGHKGHSSSAHDPVDNTSIGETNLADSPSDQMQAQLNTHLQGDLRVNSDQNSQSGVDGLPKGPVLSTDSTGASVEAPDPLESSTHFNTVVETPSRETNHVTRTTEARATGASSIETTRKESRDKESASNHPSQPHAEGASAASLSLGGMSSHSEQSLRSRSMTPVTQSEPQPQLQANGERSHAQGDLSHNGHTGVQRNNLNNGDNSHKGTESGGKDLVADGKESTTLHPVSGGISIKTYIIIASFTPLGRVFSKKKRKKRKEIREELDKMMYSSTISKEKQIYLPYGHPEHSEYEDPYEN